jgi:protein CsiD
VRESPSVGQHPFLVAAHPEHSRIRAIAVDPEAVRSFLKRCGEETIQSLTYVPFSRLVLAQHLADIMGNDFVCLLRNTLNDRNTGGFTVGVADAAGGIDDYVKFATAIAHLIGIPNFDAMGGNYFARFAVQNTDASDSYLRQAYRNMTLHTDGTYVEEATDWVLMLKIEERNAVGGRSRILHLDDWKDRDRFAAHPFARKEFRYAAPASKNVDRSTTRRTFYPGNGGTCIAFIDQFVYPENREEGLYFHDLVQSLEASEGVGHLEVRPGEMLVINNHYWLHGREAFAKHPELYRELLRMRGRFMET